MERELANLIEKYENLKAYNQNEADKEDVEGSVWYRHVSIVSAFNVVIEDLKQLIKA